MARMMPAYCPADAPPGEKAVYSALECSSQTADWIVLHSLGIADHVRQVQGEADFVVIVPGAGVLVIEVKSHRSIDRSDDGVWRLGGDAPTCRGPFQQADEAMHSLRRYLGKQQVDVRSLPLLSAVWFTGVRARSMLPPNPEWHDWQVLDAEDLTTASDAVVRTLQAGTAHLSGKTSHFAFGGVGPDAFAADRVASLLRPRFEVCTVAGDRRRARETELVTFVDEQFLALDAMSSNRSVLFWGPAGSGKTFLAMESARREVAAGHQGQLLCFNKLLGKRLAEDMAGVQGLRVGTFHQELLRLSGMDRAPEDAGPRFWAKELPELALGALIERGEEPMSSFLVIDEIQDIATGAYLDLLDLMVDGGLRAGRLLLFGDFERQALFGDDSGRELVVSRAPQVTSFQLMKNCRNRPRIGYQVNLLSRLQPGYQHFLRQDDGVDPEFRPYRRGQDQSAQLAAAIRGLREDGYRLNEIVVLSPGRGGSTASTTTDPWLRQVLHPADGLPPRQGQVQYSSIHAFKGLDAPAIVVTDLDDERYAETFDALLYVGLTRATDRLIALIETTTFRRRLGGTP